MGASGDALCGVAVLFITTTTTTTRHRQKSAGVISSVTVLFSAIMHHHQTIILFLIPCYHTACIGIYVTGTRAESLNRRLQTTLAQGAGHGGDEHLAQLARVIDVFTDEEEGLADEAYFYTAEGTPLQCGGDPPGTYS